MKILDELNDVRERVGLDRLTLDGLASKVFHSKATSYAFHFSLSKEMIALVGSLAMCYSASLSASSHTLRTRESCAARGLIIHTKDAMELTRVGCSVALMLHYGEFIRLTPSRIKALKSRI